MDDRVTVAFRVPSPGIAPFVSTFYEIEIVGDPILDCLPPEWANLQTGLDEVWELGSNSPQDLAPTPSLTVLRGPTRRPTWTRGRKRVFGFGILPTGWSRLWSLPCDTLADRFVPLEQVIGPDSAAAYQRDLLAAPDFAARIAIAEHWLAQRLAEPRPGPPLDLLDRLYVRLGDPDILGIDELAEALSLSPTQFARLCKRGFGFPPKLLIRRQRFMRMLGEMHSRPYREWRDFIDPQYVDQSHMLRDFRDFLGMSPTAYFALPRPILNATTRSRAAAAGKPYQILHDPEAGRSQA